MSRNIRTVTIGSAGFTAECPVPPDRIGLWEGLALSFAGWRDGVRYREVPDTAHTHALHRINSRHRRHESEAVRRIDLALSAVDLARAEVDVVLAGSALREIVEPDARELDGRDGDDRQRWARDVRDARAANARAADDRSRRQAALVRREQLVSVRDALAIEGDDVRQQWREAYDERAARYTHARIRRTREASHAPAVAPYVLAVGPTAVRRATDTP
ncbi:hypothetical protein ACSBPH_13475 [Microbacterium sp. F51-2R]|uniref:hypothetical protein n=1 Tax=Microbacterium sp. F51-2R TaxID=3445777 RepID=UPI003FA04713